MLESEACRAGYAKRRDAGGLAAGFSRGLRFFTILPYSTIRSAGKSEMAWTDQASGRRTPNANGRWHPFAVIPRHGEELAWQCRVRWKARDGLPTGNALRSSKSGPQRIRVITAILDAVHEQLSDAARLAAGKPLLGLYYTANQILGRIHFLKWINNGQVVLLQRRYQAIDWHARNGGRHRAGLAGDENASARKNLFRRRRGCSHDRATISQA